MNRLIVVLCWMFSASALAQTYDLVIENGRALDPESGLDATRNIAVSDGKIARISSEPLAGRRVLRVRGLVVAPGFIDLHQHAQDADTGRLKAFDGVTTALELEIGVADVGDFLHTKQGRSLINYGTSASHLAARSRAFGRPLTAELNIPPPGPATAEAATEEQLRRMEERLRQELDAGGLGIGMGIQYSPGATRSEVIRIFRLAAERRVPVFAHIRSNTAREPGSNIEAVEEVIAAAVISGASLHVVHINSSCLKLSLECLSMIAGARARGVDVSTEAYPYTAGMTYLNSAVFDPGWAEKSELNYGSLQLPETGERLTQARFEELRKSPKPQLVIRFTNTQEMIDATVPHPLVMIASDGARGHPRNAGTFSRILSHYVRETGSITLLDAIRKMSLMPAQRLEKATAAAHRKGRLQEGADADIVVFDPKQVVDRATYETPLEPSAGMRFVIVNGTVLIDEGRLAPDSFPGRPLN